MHNSQTTHGRGLTGAMQGGGLGGVGTLTSGLPSATSRTQPTTTGEAGTTGMGGLDAGTGMGKPEAGMGRTETGMGMGTRGGLGMHGVNVTYSRSPILSSNNPLHKQVLRQAAFETHNFLGDSGLKVSKICLGTMTFGTMNKTLGDRPGQCTEPEAHRILDRFVELGGNCIDTSNVYPWIGTTGESERIIGNWLAKQPREKIVLITKVRYPTNFDDVNAIGLSRNHILTSVNESLKRLKTDYIDVLEINGWDEATNITNVLRTLNGLVLTGKVRHIGCCDLKGWQLQTAIDYCKLWNMEPFVTISTEYNLLTNGPELELSDICRTRHVSMMPYSPLKGGYLTSKMKRGTAPPEGSRIAVASKDRSNLAAMAVPLEDIANNPGYWQILDTCTKIAKRHGKTPAQVAIRWLMQKDFVCSVIIGVRNVQQLEENMGALTFVLTEDDMQELDILSSSPAINSIPPAPYKLDACLKYGRSRTYYTQNLVGNGPTGHKTMTPTGTPITNLKMSNSELD